MKIKAIKLVRDMNGKLYSLFPDVYCPVEYKEGKVTTRPNTQPRLTSFDGSRRPSYGPLACFDSIPHAKRFLESFTAIDMDGIVVYECEALLSKDKIFWRTVNGFKSVLIGPVGTIYADAVILLQRIELPVEIKQ